MDLYIVEANSGMWDDYITWIDCVFDDEDKAAVYIEMCQAIEREHFESLDDDDKSYFEFTGYSIAHKILNEPPKDAL